ncbi:glycosyltransferase family 2 protein [Candidatus Gottesmanbacteria bacterium]|nr:glycosyltransferase family 2 protein [Candidatus Gottesmanbacteria bacterium]
MTKLSSLSFLIPCYNDETTIERVIAEAADVGKRVAKMFEMIVINDGSRDMTGSRLVRLAKKFKELHVITHPMNQGYGRTIKELYCTGKFEWFFSIPGDYQVGASELLKLIPYIRRADMMLGWRVRRNDPPNRLIVSWVYNTLLRVLFGLKLHDINSVRLMRRSILKNIDLTSPSAFVDAELVIRAKRVGFRVAEVPIAHRARQDARQGRGNQWRTIMETIRDMVRFPYEENR